MAKTLAEQLRNIGITNPKAIKHYYYKVGCLGSAKEIVKVFFTNDNHIMFVYDDGQIMETYVF